jgi:hypothetical protein
VRVVRADGQVVPVQCVGGRGQFDAERPRVQGQRADWLGILQHFGGGGDPWVHLDHYQLPVVVDAVDAEESEHAGDGGEGLADVQRLGVTRRVQRDRPDAAAVAKRTSGQVG